MILAITKWFSEQAQEVGSCETYVKIIYAMGAGYVAVAVGFMKMVGTHKKDLIAAHNARIEDLKGHNDLVETMFRRIDRETRGGD